MSNEPKAGPGLDPELLAAYIDQRLSPEQRANVEAQLAADPDSYAVLVETMKALDSVEVPKVPEVPQVPKVPTGVSRWAVAGGVLAAAAALVLVVRLQPDWVLRMQGVDPQLQHLVDAVGDARQVEGRLAGGFRFGPLESAKRGGDGLAQQNLALLAAAGAIQRAAETDPSSENLHRWGVARLLLGDSTGAIDSLERAAGTAPSAAVLSDLVAAYLARADEGNTEDLGRALAVAERSIQMGPDSPEGWFNRALVQTRMGLNDEAAASLGKMIEFEVDPGWRAEAERLRASLRPKASGGALDVTPLREMVETQLLGEWAAAATKSDLGAIQKVTLQLEQVATQAAAVSGDRYLGDLRDDLSRAASDGGRYGPQVWRFAEAMTFAAQDQNAKVAAALTPVLPELCEWSAAMCATGSLAAAVAGGGDGDEYVNRLEQLQPSIQARPYSTVKGMFYWRLGLARLRRGDYEFGIAAYERAYGLFQAAGELSHAANMKSLEAEAFRGLGDVRQAWRYHLAAVAVADRPTPRVRHQVLAQMVLTCLNMQLPECAVGVLEGVKANAARWGQPGGTAMTHIHAARALARLGRQESRAELRAASAAIATMSDPALRFRNEAELASASSEVLASLDALEEFSNVERGVEAFEKLGAANRAALLRLTLGRSLVKRGQVAQATEVFEKAVKHIEDATATGRGGPSRSGQRGALSALLTELSSIRLQAGDEGSALALVERSRFHLSDGVLAAVDHPLPVTRIQQNLGGQTALIYFATDVNPASAWVITESRVQRVELQVKGDELRELVAKYRDAVSGRTHVPLDGYVTALSRILVAPLFEHAKFASNWIVVPDASIAGIGITTLQEPSGAPLFTTRLVSISPNGSLVDLSGRQHGVAAAFVGFAEAPAGTLLPALPNVRAEVRAAALHYAAPLVFLDREATPGSLIKAMQTADIVHIAAHAVARGEYPGLSRLLLAPPDASTTGYLYADQIAQMTGVRARIVILAGCRTGYAGSSSTAAGEAILNMTMPFLRAGVRQVVASLWDVPDSATKELMVAFHRNLSLGADGVAALAEAQKQVALSPNAASILGAFQVYGS